MDAVLISSAGKRTSSIMTEMNLQWMYNIPLTHLMYPLPLLPAEPHNYQALFLITIGISCLIRCPYVGGMWPGMVQKGTHALPLSSLAFKAACSAKGLVCIFEELHAVFCIGFPLKSIQNPKTSLT